MSDQDLRELVAQLLDLAWAGEPIAPPEVIEPVLPPVALVPARHLGIDLQQQPAGHVVLEHLGELLPAPQLQIASGYAQVLPGTFLKSTTPGESYGLSYLMVTYVFLGDKPATSPRGGQR
jgi:hypothetical protein